MLNFATHKLKIQKKQLSAAIALALMLTIFATLGTSVPNTYGQIITGQVLSTSANVNVVLKPIGLGQVQMVRATMYPVLYSINHTYTITKPDGTKFTLVNASNVRTEESFVTFVCDQLGTWSVTISWTGDATHKVPVAATAGYLSATWLVQSANVTDPPTKLATKCFIGTVPKDKIGTGQAIYIVGWVSPPREYASAIYPEFDFVITKPDGTTDTHVEQPESPATSSFSYVCSQAGTYSVVLKFPEDYLHEASQSPAITWTAEDGYVAPTYADQPLPTGPWTYPIPNEYQQWFQISGPWPEAQFNASYCNFNPWSTAPNTPHVLWRLQETLAGIMGGSPEYGGGGVVGLYVSVPVLLRRKEESTSPRVNPSIQVLPRFSPHILCCGALTNSQDK